MVKQANESSSKQAQMNAVWQRIEQKNVNHSGGIVNDLMSNERGHVRKDGRKWMIVTIIVSVVAVVAIGATIYLVATRDDSEPASNNSLQLSEEQLKINDDFIARAKEVAETASTTDDPAERQSLYNTELQLYQAAGDAEGAQTVVDKILTDYPDDFTSYSIAGDFYSSSLGGGDKARAVGYYNKVLDILRQQESTDETAAKINYYQGRVNELSN